MDAALADTAYRKSDTGAWEPVPGALTRDVTSHKVLCECASVRACESDHGYVLFHVFTVTLYTVSVA
jgi:hypothetical protein